MSVASESKVKYPQTNERVIVYTYEHSFYTLFPQSRWIFDRISFTFSLDLTK
jgi:hypothetical protein